MTLDFGAIVKRMMESCGDGCAYVVDENYKQAADLFGIFNAENNLEFERDDYDDGIVFQRGQEGVVFTNELTAESRDMIAKDGDAIWGVA